MALIRLRGTCPDGTTCPTLYRDTATGDLVVQGSVVTHIDGMPLPVGEAAVRVPAELLVEAGTRPGA